jgi:hypothetical protein
LELAREVPLVVDGADKGVFERLSCHLEHQQLAELKAKVGLGVLGILHTPYRAAHLMAGITIALAKKKY